MKTNRLTKISALYLAWALAAWSGLSPAGGALAAQIAVPPPTLLPLNQIAVPEPPSLFQYLKSPDAAIRLGKAFFWDMQTGSDGIQACGTCHFSGGVDIRRKNTVNPGTNAAVPDTTFQVRGPNETLLDTDFPFHMRQNPDFQSSPVLRDSNDVVGSQGVRMTQFVRVVPGSAVDDGTPLADPIFKITDPATNLPKNVRQVTARNTPSNINAIFNFSNFWDGRAYFAFNGVNPFGALDTSAGVYFNTNGTLARKPVAIDFASLASQATGPPLSDVEMSYRGRTFPELGRKMMSLTPLGKQYVHPGDSVLGPLSGATLLPNARLTGSRGLTSNYRQMIQDAFLDYLWNSTQTVSLPTVANPGGEPFSQLEANFSLFWGLAIQLYEATLVSDNTPYDRFLGGELTALTDAQQRGFNIFTGVGRCTACHAGSELSNASVGAAAFVTIATNALMEQMPVASGQQILYDAGFNNTGVTATTQDIGRAGNSPFTNAITQLPLPLSFCKLSELQALGNLPFLAPPLPVNLPASFPVANDGNFKVPGLRNVELTGPYFHNGGMRTLNEVVDFYTRGGNFPLANAASLDIAIAEIPALQVPTGPGNDPQGDLVAFLMSLTDDRVRTQSAPFDHPEIFIPEGDPEVLTRLPAKNAVGAEALPSALAVTQVVTPTNKTSQTVGGTMDPGSIVTVSVNGVAAVVTTPTPTTWSVSVSGLVAGANTVTITAVDATNISTSMTAPVQVILPDGLLTGGATLGVADALKALRIAVKLDTATVDQLLHGDVAPLDAAGKPAPDGAITVADALLILKKSVGVPAF